MALYDTGATISAISLKLCNFIKANVQESDKSISLANCVKTKSFGRAIIPVSINGICKEISFEILENLKHSVILGLNCIKSFGLEQRKDLRVYMNDVVIFNEYKSSSNEIQSLENENWSKIVDQFSDLFEGIGKNERIFHSISLTSDKVIRHKIQQIPIHWKVQLKEHIKELKEMKVIKESTSEFRSRIVPIKKKDGTVRMAIDYRDLNKITRHDAFPMPRINDIIIKVSKATIFSKLDLKKGYYNVMMDKDSRKYTAFAFENKLYEFERMPFGLVSAPQTFQRMMEMILGHLEFVECYLDDIIVFSENKKQHENHLKQVFNILRKEKLRLNKEKCEFGKSVIEYLGFKIDSGKRSIISVNKEKILKFPRPSNQQEAKTFVCLANYYRDLIENFSKLALPLYECSNQRKFVWKEEQEKSFMDIKKIIEKDPSVKIPDPNIPFIVTTDASDRSFGGTLSQIIDGEKMPVDFFSRNFNQTQCRYSTYEKEATAIIEALKHWRLFLLGKPFRIESDHRPLRWLLSKRDCSSKLGRMVLKLQEFQIENIDYIKGSDNVLADALSRLQMNLLSSDAEDELDDVIEKDKANFIKKDGRWFFVDKSREREILRLYVKNENERRNILKVVHENGHLGLFKNEEELRRRFWWPFWRKELKAFIKNCSRCEFFKNDDEKTKLPMVPSVLEPLNWCKVGLDFCGPLQVSEAGNKFVILIQDYASKFLLAEAVRDLKSDSLIAWLRHVFGIFGWPKSIVCDRGPQLESRKFKEFCSANNVNIELISLGHHQSNGLVERAIRTVEDMLRTSVLDKKNWDMELPSLVSAYNGSIHHSTKIAPFKLMFGHDMSIPLDLKYNICHKFEDVSDLARKRILENEAAQMKQKCYYDRKIKLEPLFSGDLVLWHQWDHSVGSSKKLNKKWRGPFVIKNRSVTNYEIADKNGNSRWIHHNHLKRFNGDSATPLDTIRNRGRPAHRS